MIHSGDSLPHDGTTPFDVAIVGAGAVGIALAVRLAGRIGRIALIEAGGTQFAPAHNLSYFKADRIDDARHSPTELNRRRMLGGTTSVWGGRCIPFDPEDFAPTADRPGWPIPYADFAAHIPDALAFLDAGRADFSADKLGHRAALDSVSADLLLDRIERYSKPTNVWREWGERLAHSPHVTVIHDAACTGVMTNEDGTRAVALKLQTASGRRHRVAAPTIVLACGGLETPRLLLASRDTRSCGLGNEHDLVGRFYMTHLVSNASNVGAVQFADPAVARAFDFSKTIDGVYGRRMILLSPAARARAGLPNIVFRPGRPPMDDASHRDAVLSTMFLVRNMLIPPEYARSMVAGRGASAPARAWRDHGGNIARDVPSLVRFSLDWLRRRVLAQRKLPSVFLYRKDGSYPLEYNAEQLPNADSRVFLGRQTDPLGMPRLIVQWKFADRELDSICRAYRVLASAVARSGLGEIRLDPDLPGSLQRATVPQGGHHIGTVRMGADARTGVVDANAEVWGTRGLFVAGTAVLPTSGFANPTLTAVGLALRLAEHLVSRQNGNGNVPEAVPRSVTADSAD